MRRPVACIAAHKAAKMPQSPPRLHGDNKHKGQAMRLVLACCSLSIALALFGCASQGTAPAPSLPPTVDNGIGSEYGNYASQRAGETRGPAGERCVFYNWDRPLAKNLAVRARSESCALKDHPDRAVSTELSRTVIPMSESTLAAKHASQP